MVTLIDPTGTALRNAWLPNTAPYLIAVNTVVTNWIQRATDLRSLRWVDKGLRLN